MSEIQNLIAEEAVSKLQEIVKGSRTCMFATKLEQAPFHVIPMRVQEADYEGNLWFFSSKDSTHNAHVREDPRVQLIFANSPDMEFMTVFGNASISTDKDKIDRLWDEMVGSWFEGGKEDPNISLICVQPALAHYWDTEDGKIVTTAKMLTRAVTGSDIDPGVEGSLNV
ncbi:MAG: pyridoxamine 5'-phosphate oxidase family protein [Akkermansiaceae bacterium]|jgi:general stress protein 26|nr:pyridoxamine 5'-phosphate oxidase family protein [Akkermansiaceae bacterium]MDP4645748.1 pyridoxamine 5'-phosphate oxidase family protein [Akkermansiaceae bacterium]MDP4720589.1 pyridoxamine 5'-phosphate oxidase family protein [Akkermansiaceae bacterium]MDP4781505.1 pyridoxamine 5'-phosphate oxidase family protein [Akkermansiaceae bacterium]MDP4847608.1 pyridoxamine 5'-phosphate oxidase family protein [Akkermansiaceae bacterium]